MSLSDPVANALTKIRNASRAKHPTTEVRASKLIEREAPISAAKLALVCPRCSKPTRVGYVVKDKAKNRVCKQCQEVIVG